MPLELEVRINKPAHCVLDDSVTGVQEIPGMHAIVAVSILTPTSSGDVVVDRLAPDRARFHLGEHDQLPWLYNIKMVTGPVDSIHLCTPRRFSVGRLHKSCLASDSPLWRCKQQMESVRQIQSLESAIAQSHVFALVGEMARVASCHRAIGRALLTEVMTPQEIDETFRLHILDVHELQTAVRGALHEIDVCSHNVARCVGGLQGLFQLVINIQEDKTGSHHAFELEEVPIAHDALHTDAFLQLRRAVMDTKFVTRETLLDTLRLLSDVVSYLRDTFLELSYHQSIGLRMTGYVSLASVSRLSTSSFEMLRLGKGPPSVITECGYSRPSASLRTSFMARMIGHSCHYLPQAREVKLSSPYLQSNCRYTGCEAHKDIVREAHRVRQAISRRLPGFNTLHGSGPPYPKVDRVRFSEVLVVYNVNIPWTKSEKTLERALAQFDTFPTFSFESTLSADMLLMLDSECLDTEMRSVRQKKADHED